MPGNILQLENIKTHFPLYRGVVFKRHAGDVRAVDGVSISIAQGEIIGLVGESGCGKSTLARTIMHLVPMTDGAIILEEKNFGHLSHKKLRRLRPDIQMIFQDPYASLNPRMTVFDIIAEGVLVKEKVSRDKLTGTVGNLMERVGLAPQFMKKYPHEFSGGQRQRIAIARVLALKPKIIIADEPVSALDVSVQAQILNLIVHLSREMSLTLLFISHDLSVVKHISDRIAVMYLGKIVEIGKSEEICDRPSHPYTKALISAVPLIDPEQEQKREKIILKGDPPSPITPPTGCTFHPRCPFAHPECSALEPILEPFKEDNLHLVSCIRKNDPEVNS